LQLIFDLVARWIASTGFVCDCHPPELPAKRGRGRPPKEKGACRACWRSFAADRALSPPHDLSLATRCLHELRYTLPDLEASDVKEALHIALPKAGFRLEYASVRPLLRDGQRSRIAAWTVFGWRDRRSSFGYLFVKASGISGSGGGAFATEPLAPGDWLGRFTGVSVPAAAIPDLPNGASYVKRVGPRYVDARDPAGRLRLSDGRLVDVHQFSEADWGGLEANPGVAWEGKADLSRFIQHRPAAGDVNAVIRGSDVFATKAIPMGGELFVDYGAAYWGPRLKQPRFCSICLKEEVFELQLFQCGRCGNYGHVSCVKEWIRSVISASCECPLDLCSCKRVPSCPSCREPLPRELGHRREVCRTPGCIRLIWHAGHCDSQPQLGKRRSVAPG
jgi:hypothetical protein